MRPSWRFPPEPSCARQAPPTMAMSSLSIRRTARKSGGFRRPANGCRWSRSRRN